MIHVIYTNLTQFFRVSQMAPSLSSSSTTTTSSSSSFFFFFFFLLLPPLHPLLTQEYDHQMRRDAFEEDDMKQRHIFESKQLPKQIKAEYKQQLAELKKSMKLKRSSYDRSVLRKVLWRIITLLQTGSHYVLVASRVACTFLNVISQKVTH